MIGYFDDGSDCIFVGLLFDGEALTSAVCVVVSQVCYFGQFLFTFCDIGYGCGFDGVSFMCECLLSFVRYVETWAVSFPWYFGFALGSWVFQWAVAL